MTKYSEFRGNTYTSILNNYFFVCQFVNQLQLETI